MAAGNWTFPDGARTRLLNGTFDLDTDTFKIALFTPTVTVSDNKVVTPGTASLILTRFAPTLTVPLGLRGLFDQGTIHPSWCYAVPDETPANWQTAANNLHGTLAITPTGQVYVWASGSWVKVGTQA